MGEGIRLASAGAFLYLYAAFQPPKDTPVRRRCGFDSGGIRSPPPKSVCRGGRRSSRLFATTTERASMAGARSNPDSPNRLRFAVFLGVVVLGGAIVCGQVPLPPATQDPVQNVVEVRVIGANRIDLKKIHSQIRTRTGRPFDLDLIEEDVRRLYKTGWFVTVRPKSQSVDGGRVVIFDLLERPLLQYVKYVGNEKIVKSKLEKEADIKTGDALNLFAVEEARRRVEEFYRGHGFSKARVSIIEGNKPSDRGVVFLINEGRKQRIWKTRFIGNTIASDARLKTQIRSKPGILWVFKGEVNQDQIDEDVQRLTAYYRSLGFFRARVGRYLEFTDKQDWLTLTYVIDEGPRFKVRNVSFLGNTKIPSDDLTLAVNLKAGEFFNQAAMQRDVATIRDRYGSIGYIFADVNADPRFLEQPGELDLVYNVREGYQCRVGRIVPRIEGEFPHTKITTILNRMSVKPGDIIDIRELRASERRLQASGLFEVDPQRGVSPKIVFSPPNLEEIDVQQAGHTEGIRGQSPDGRPHAAYRPPRGAGSSPNDRIVDVAVQGKWIGQGENPGAVAHGSPSNSVLWVPGAARLPLSVDQQGRASRPCHPGDRAGFPVGSTPQSWVRPTVRGQYSAGAGRTVPSYSSPGTTSPARQPYSAPSRNAAQNTAASVSRMPPPAQLPPPGSAPTQFFGGGGPSYGQPGATGSPSLLGDPPVEEPPIYIPLEPMVQEGRTGRFMLSVGVNSDAGLLGSIIVDEQNFDLFRLPRSWQDIRDGIAWRGAGQRLRIEAVPGTLVQRYTINFQEPYLFNSRVSLGVSGYFYNRWYDEWDEERIGGRLALGYQFTHDLSGSVAYRGAKINIGDPIVRGIPELESALGDNTLHGLQLRLSHDTRDSSFLPTQGHLIELSYEQVTGSFEYPRGEVNARRYLMLHQRPDGSGRHVLSLGGRMAVSGNDTPIYEHYFAGGFSTIRGFDFRGASPRDPSFRQLVGGEFMLLASAEYMFPITADDSLRGVVFCDTGTVEPSINDWSNTYRISPGFGLRITVPAMGPAPIALDFGFPISNNPGDQKEVFSFFVGFLR